MLKTIIELLKNTELDTSDVKMALGRDKFPSNFREFVNYIKLK